MPGLSRAHSSPGQPAYGFTEFLRTLWREQHRGVPEQDVLPLVMAPPMIPASQTSLFEAA